MGMTFKTSSQLGGIAPKIRPIFENAAIIHGDSRVFAEIISRQS